MSQKLHLDTSVFRIHWLDAETFRAYNVDVVNGIVFFVQIFLAEIGSCSLMTFRQFVLIFVQLPLNYLFHKVD